LQIIQVQVVLLYVGTLRIRKRQLIQWLGIREIDFIFVYYHWLYHLFLSRFHGLKRVEKVVAVEIYVQLFGVQIHFGRLVHTLEEAPKLIVLLLIRHLKWALCTASRVRAYAFYATAHLVNFEGLLLIRVDLVISFLQVGKIENVGLFDKGSRFFGFVLNFGRSLFLFLFHDDVVIWLWAAHHDYIAFHFRGSLFGLLIL